MRKRIPVVLGLALSAAISATPTLRSDEPTLQAGVQQVRDGDFDAGVVTLDGVIRRLGAESPARAGDLSQAYLYKGVALVGLEQEEPAKTAFRDALKHDPQLQLSEREFSPRVVRVFDATRKGKSKSVLYASGGVGIGAIVAGVALAGGGATAVAATAGPAPTPAPTPTPSYRPSRITAFESFSPPAGGTVTASRFNDRAFLGNGPVVVVRIEFTDDPACGGNVDPYCVLETGGVEQFFCYTVRSTYVASQVAQRL